MSLKRFNADVRSATDKIQARAVEGISSIGRGDSDGEFVISYVHDDLPRPLDIRVLAQDVGEYPDGNNFLIFTECDDAPENITSTLTELQQYTFGQNVFETVLAVAKTLTKSLAASSDVNMTDVDEGDEYVDDEDDDGDLSDHYDDDDLFGLAPAQPHVQSTTPHHPRGLSELQSHIKRDFRKLRDAGFRVGILSGMEATSQVSLFSASMRANKLGLSEEVLQAWDIDAADYIVLLCRIEGPYPKFKRVMETPTSGMGLEFRIGSCRKYKPSPQQAQAAFITSKRPVALDDDGTDPTPRDHPEEAVFRKLFVSSSIDSFMTESFLPLLKVRHNDHHPTWDGAISFINNNLGNQVIQKHPTGPSTSSPLPTSNTDHPMHGTPPPTLGDHLEDAGEKSVPLIAAQFAMHFLVKCTKYCLRCHSRLEEGFDAIRPYVCSNPLCLFQYMNMGLGPSLEHEILTQPYVVDLLVSFCYSSLQVSQTSCYGLPARRAIREYPVGLRFKVPDIRSKTGGGKAIEVRTTLSFETVQIENPKDFDRIAPNTWVAFIHDSNPVLPHAPANHMINVFHGKIVATDRAKGTVEVELRGKSGLVRQAGAPGPFVYAPRPASSTSSPAPLVGTVPTSMMMCLYDLDFDDLDDTAKAGAMIGILDTLPPVWEIKAYLVDHPHASFKSFKKISSAAAVLLEWIVASNRSCIFQVDRIVDHNVPSDGEQGRTAGGKTRDNEKIPGMDNWVQFRFAQGSPDKELRFNRALREVAVRKKLVHPTLFAWHGSALGNWHSILRHGLDFKEVRNGRAYGNGVYFSQDFAVSNNYAHGWGSLGVWPNSALKVSAAVSLNEIINAPDEFASCEPHLVVAEVDWIQCRYLFIQRYQEARQSDVPDATAPAVATTKPPAKKTEIVMLDQDPLRRVKGPDGVPIQIPLCAVPSARTRQAAHAAASPTQVGLGIADDSDEDEAIDVDFLLSDSERGPPKKQRRLSESSSVDTTTARNIVEARPLTPAYTDKSQTDFCPGTLDLASLPRLQPPNWATDSATKQIGREVKRLADVQSKTPLHELGWYIDFENLDNMFQWIVELHSFDPSLPLAQDMKAAGVTSIVLEIRFGRDFPFSPPFVRIIRPRFLPFAEGGGGHVTAGGAMCMELLTNNGWTPANSMESVLVQVRTALLSTEPVPARLMQSSTVHSQGGTAGLGGFDYNVSEAIDAYERACRAHGWVVPKDLRETATQFIATAAPHALPNAPPPPPALQ